MRRALIAFTVLVTASQGTCVACTLSDQLIGYTVALKKTIVAHIKDGERTDGFDGCNFGEIIVFDDETGVRCNGYSYHYAYRPEAYILLNGSSIKTCADGEWYDVGSIR